MTTLAQRQQLITLIDQATNAGARLHIACSEVSISKRTYRRWKADNSNQGDKRTTAIRPIPSNKLSDSERQAILDVCNEPRFASLPPSQIVPTLLDEGIYHASESSFYRVLKGHNQLKPRGRAKPLILVNRQKLLLPPSLAKCFVGILPICQARSVDSFIIYT